MSYFSPTLGKVSETQIKQRIKEYTAIDPSGSYTVIIGVDSQRSNSNSFDFVTALVVRHMGKGGIYFWKREKITKPFSLKERMYTEALMALKSAEEVVKLLKTISMKSYDIEIHVDIGKKGKTNEVINEIVGMVLSNGYNVKTKPDSFGASKVADRHT